MQLEFKPDFAAARELWTAFWRGENRRPLLSFVLPKEGVEPVAPPRYMAGADGEFEPVIDQVLGWAASHEFLGEAIPYYYVTFGPDHFSALLGADLRVNSDSADTSWIVPFVRDWDDAEIRFRPDGEWWRRTAAFLRALRRRCDGRLLLAPPTLVANLDALSAVRGINELLLDLVMCPDKIHRALDQVGHAYEEILDALAAELDVPAWGGINRHGFYSPGRINVPQCDFSCMISPAMFAEFVVPALEREVAPLDAAEYHLDGPGAIQHLEALCAIDGIGVIQWVPGAGAAAERDWTDLYRRIDALGKGQILGGPPERVRHFCELLESRQLFFRVHVGSKREAMDFMDEMDKER